MSVKVVWHVDTLWNVFHSVAYAEIFRLGELAELRFAVYRGSL
jgi:hypothetical protein